MSRYLVLVAIWTLPVCGQNSSTPLTNETIIRLVASGVAPDTVINTIRSAVTVSFGFLPGDLELLQRYHIPDDVVKAMAAKSNGRPISATPNTSSQPLRTVPPPSPNQVQATSAQPEALDRDALSKLAKWQDAVLVNFRTVQSGSACSSSGTVNGTVDESGNVTGRTHGNSSCVTITTRFYTLSAGEHTYVLRHELTAGKKATVIATLGYGALFMKNSVLANQLPGVHVLARTDPKGFWVKIGSRESKYQVVEAH